MFHDKAREHYYTAEEADQLDGEVRKALVEKRGGSDLFYQTLYGTPLAYARALDLAASAGIDAVKGRRVLDFGCGGIAQLRLLASLGALAVGVDVDPFLEKLYSRPGDLGPYPDRGGGNVDLVIGRFPAEPRARQRVGGGYSLIVTKNTLKNGYLHPAVEVPPRQQFKLGVKDDEFVRALHGALEPGGVVVVYNIGPPPAPAGKKYRPHADIRNPFPRASWEKAGFEVVAFDQDDRPAMRRLARVFSWDTDHGMNLETDLFALYSIARRR